MYASDFNLAKVEIMACQPQAADSRKIQYVDQRKQRVGDQASPSVVYLVKLYMDLGILIDRPSQGFRLYIGDTEIRKYAAFNEGIYFKIHDVDQLTDFSEQEVRFCVDYDEMVDSGVHCPAYSAYGSNAEAVPAMISQAEALQY